MRWQCTNNRAGWRGMKLQVVTTLFVWIIWLVMMTQGEHWHLFQHLWHMTVTMCLGSFIAGATSEGGGAVAFPVMTLVFNVQPSVARDFGLMIQSVGMTAAALLIILRRIPVEWRAIRWGSLGGALGIVFGLEYVAPRLPPAYIKMFFTSLWLSFGLALYWINRCKDRQVAMRLPEVGWATICVLLFAGCCGGIVSSLTSSGLDIVLFALLTLAFGICEKVATPTSVILMAGNTLIGFAYRDLISQEIAVDSWEYWYVCVPVVVVGAPVGAAFIQRRSRSFVALFLYVSIVTQFIGAWLILERTPAILGLSIGTIVMGSALFGMMASFGTRRFALQSSKSLLR